MNPAILKGLIMGLFLSVFIGPVFFLLIETSINKGFRRAFVMNIGVIVSDILWVILLYWGIEKFLGDLLRDPNAMLVAGIIFILFGINGVYNHNKKGRKIRLEKRKRTLFIQGFMLNSINPSVALFWLATLTLANQEFDNQPTQILLFFVTIFITVLSIDSIKFITAKKLGQFLNARTQQKLSVITGLIMIAFGAYMVINRFY